MAGRNCIILLFEEISVSSVALQRHSWGKEKVWEWDIQEKEMEIMIKSKSEENQWCEPALKPIWGNS